MHVNYSYLHQQFAEVEEYFKDLRGLVASGEFTLGPYVEKFEKKFADYIGIKYAFGVNTGTEALMLCLKGVGVKPGDEVITVPNTFVATVGAIVGVGARPVFVDCDKRYQIDASKIAKAITKRVRAILPVHWAGCPPEIEEILEIGRKNNLPVVEDACPAVGAKVGKKFAGTFGRCNAFSMHPLKPLNVWGDGGIVVTDDDEIADWLRLYRYHGMKDRDHVEIWGVNNRLQPVQAVVATRLLDDMEKLIEARIRNARRLDAGLRDLEEFVKLPPRPAGYREVYQLYIAEFQRREELLRYLDAHEIDARVHYPIPLHLQNASKPFGYKRGDFPVAERQADTIVTLPSHQHINEDQVDYMLDVIHKFYGF
jgi:dTDP-4-amino-4,6-dideoxygalactose transaminase